MRKTLRCRLTLFPLAFAALIAALPVSAADPARLYAKHCALCHEGGVPKAPHSITFLLMGTRAIHAAMTTGPMRIQASALSVQERKELAEYLGGHALDTSSEPQVAQCKGAAAEFDPKRPPAFEGWGLTLSSNRFIPANVAQLTTSDIPRLTLEWAFAFPGATRARSQPGVAGGAIYVGSQDGTVYALDFGTGCIRWRFSADAEVRTAIVIEPWQASNKTPSPRAFFADLSGQAYAVDARSGKLLWKRRVDTHQALTITGSPRYYGGRLYVPLSSTEFAAAADPEYACCTFQGGVAALDATTGAKIWTTYSIPELPKPSKERTPGGKQRFAPAGVPVWTSPTIDVKRNRLYIGTGESYTSPAAPTSDAVLAIDLSSGAIVWHYQSLAKDAWTLACFFNGPNCPKERGTELDLDIATPPAIVSTKGAADILVAGQKTGHLFAIDPNNGKLLWRQRLGRGGYAGGIHWGVATEGQTIFAPVSDTVFFPTDVERGVARPGLFAIDAPSGKTKWFTPAPDLCDVKLKPACDPGISAAATAIPGIVFTGGFDGRLRAYASDSGRVLWEFDTNRKFATLSGAAARGGTIGSAGPVVAYGALLVNSGYLMGGTRMPGNVLLKFSVPKPKP